MKVSLTALQIFVSFGTEIEETLETAVIGISWKKLGEHEAMSES